MCGFGDDPDTPDTPDIDCRIESDNREDLLLEEKLHLLLLDSEVLAFGMIGD